MLALLLVSVDMRVADLHQWAREALVEERRVQELGDDWKPLDASSSWSMKGKAGAMLHSRWSARCSCARQPRSRT